LTIQEISAAFTRAFLIVTEILKQYTTFQKQTASFFRWNNGKISCKCCWYFPSI